MIQKPAAYLRAASAWGLTAIITDILVILGAGKPPCLSLGKKAWVALQTWNYKTVSSL